MLKVARPADVARQRTATAECERSSRDKNADRLNVSTGWKAAAEASQAGCVGTVQNWKDISPRIGVAYDVFGDGRTAVKASFAKYVNGEQIATANAAGNSPVSTLGLTDRRTWNDVDGKGAECGVRSAGCGVRGAECGVLSHLVFRTPDFAPRTKSAHNLKRNVGVASWY